MKIDYLLEALIWKYTLIVDGQFRLDAFNGIHVENSPTFCLGFTSKHAFKIRFDKLKCASGYGHFSWFTQHLHSLCMVDGSAPYIER